MGHPFSIRQHRLQGARQLDSPNHSSRDPDCDIDLLIIHNISLPPGEFGTGCIDELFCNRLEPDAHPYFTGLQGLHVSSHLLIDRLGAVTQYVSFDRKAWHAGESCYEGRPDCNAFSIGIELEGTDDCDFTDRQYTVLAQVTDLLMTEYPCLNARRIVGHSDVAPGRKTDPGPHFDWSRYRHALAAAASDSAELD